MDLRLSVRTKRIALLLTGLVASTSLLSAQEKLTLDECREMAKTHSRVLQQKDAEREAAHARKQEVFTKFFPQVTARGAYLHMQKEFTSLTGTSHWAPSTSSSPIACVTSAPSTCATYG